MKNDAIHTLMSNKFMKDDFNGYQMLILDGYYATQKIRRMNDHIAKPIDMNIVIQILKKYI